MCVKLLYADWAQLRNLVKPQPLWAIQYYFGQKVRPSRYIFYICISVILYDDIIHYQYFSSFLISSSWWLWSMTSNSFTLVVSNFWKDWDLLCIPGALHPTAGGARSPRPSCSPLWSICSEHRGIRRTSVSNGYKTLGNIIHDYTYLIILSNVFIKIKLLRGYFIWLCLVIFENLYPNLIL